MWCNFRNALSSKTQLGKQKLAAVAAAAAAAAAATRCKWL